MGGSKHLRKGNESAARIAEEETEGESRVGKEDTFGILICIPKTGDMFLSLQ